MQFERRYDKASFPAEQSGGNVIFLCRIKAVFFLT